MNLRNEAAIIMRTGGESTVWVSRGSEDQSDRFFLMVTKVRDTHMEY